LFRILLYAKGSDYMQNSVKIVKQVSQSFYKKNTHLSYEEILDVALNSMIKALETYNPKKERTLNSWIAFIAHRELRKNFKKYTPEFEFIDYLTETNIYDPERICMFKETMENLSETAKYTVHMLLNGDISFANNKNEIKRNIKTKLREKGYAWNKIQSAFSELKTYAKEYI
jgi:methylaspartate ammonia-lyase